jgi:hypothetical protein
MRINPTVVGGPERTSNPDAAPVGSAYKRITKGKEKEMLKFYKAYLHGEKETAWHYNEENSLGMNEESAAFKKFIYSLYEVELDMEVDTDTGATRILTVNGIKLEQPARAG